ncbi:hypothetical protein LTR84_012039 [Exophiala bonariae]|uniref:C2H2-type domain-containing protein n=1 Tax=Exophiala bonariae TaxID=1690606 RepID=A0AAV9NIT0_9EURO|nr:hypothetical protein LTR84_012039 [Exophiala bonariae]
MTSWVCSEATCNKTFRRRYHLLRHQSNVHTRARPHTCPSCYRAFARKDALLRHKRFHAENPFWSGSRSAQLSTSYGTDDEGEEGEVVEGDGEGDLEGDSITYEPSIEEEDSTLIDHPVPLDPLLTDAESSDPFGRQALAANNDRIANINLPRSEAQSAARLNAPMFLEPSARPLMPWESSTPLTMHSTRLGSDHEESVIDTFSLESPDLNSMLRAQSGSVARKVSPVQQAMLSAPTMDLGPSDHGSSVFDVVFPPDEANSTDLSSILRNQTSIANTISVVSSTIAKTGLPPHIEPYSQIGNGSPKSALNDDSDILRSVEANIPMEYFELMQKLCAVSLLQSYFTSLHHQWPLIHEESFWGRKQPLLLKCALGLLGLVVSSNPDKTVVRSVSGLNSLLRNRLREQIQQAIPERKPSSTVAYQVYLLTMLFTLYVKDAPGIAEARSHLMVQVDQIRRAGLLNFETIVAQDDQAASPYSRWVVREEKQRLVFSTFRLDCYLHILDDLPPTMRFQELCLPLPCTDKAWNSSKKDWKETISQEPSNRTSSNYGIQCFLAMSRLSPCSRLNLPGFRTIHDFELGLVSMQARSWEETQHQTTSFDGFAAGQDAPADHLSAGGFGQSWPVLWGIWHVTMEQFRSSHVAYCPHPSEKETYLTSLLMYHASLLRVYVDMKILRRLVMSLTRDGFSSPAKRQMETLVHDWARSGRAKDALWHAAQILRLHSEHAPELRAQSIPINPVALDCVFRAGLVVWAISRSTQNCGLCAPGATPFEKVKLSRPHPHPHPHPGTNAGSHNNKVLRPRTTSSGSGSVELTTIDNLTRDYELWLEESGDSGELLVDGVVVCACHMAALVDKFQSQIHDPALGSSDIPSYVDMLNALKDHG